MNKLFRLIVDNKADKPRPFNLAKNGDTASLYIYDVISADWGVSALSVIEAINQAGDVQTLNIHINSPGGDVFEGRAIMAVISAFRGKTVAGIDSLCASAATSIALACNEIRMSEGAFFMIHNASGLHGATRPTCAIPPMCWKDRRCHRQRLHRPHRQARAGNPRKMQAETWFTAQEALEYGFIDSITEKSTAKNTWNLSAFANPPKPLPDPEPEPVKNETEPARAGFLCPQQTPTGCGLHRLPSASRAANR